MIRTLSFATLALALATNARSQDASTVPLSDEYFAMKAYSDGMAEVAKGKLAAEQATEPGVKAFAEKMVKHHGECNEKISELARKKAIALPKGTDAVHAAATARLAKLSGSDFDKAYLMGQIGAHEDAIQLFGREAFKGKDDEVKRAGPRDDAGAVGPRQDGLRAGGGEAGVREVPQDPRIRQGPDASKVTRPDAAGQASPLRGAAEMKIGFHASHELYPPGELVHYLSLAERAGFEAAMCSEHSHPWTEAQGQSGFAWAWLGAAMPVTGLTFGVVNAPGQHYPRRSWPRRPPRWRRRSPRPSLGGVGHGAEPQRAHHRRCMAFPSPSGGPGLREAVAVIRPSAAGRRSNFTCPWFRVEEARIYTHLVSPPAL